MSKVMEEAAAVLRLEQQELVQQGRKDFREPRHFAILPRHMKADGSTYVPKNIGRLLSDKEIELRELQNQERETRLEKLRITPLYHRVVHENYASLNQLVYLLNRQLVTDIRQVPT